MKNLTFAFIIASLSLSASAAYKDHFSTYFEYCTGTQWKLQSGDVGGSPGHSFIYVHGLCKDYRSSYPQVIPCSEVSEQLKADYPHEGVGISLDKDFSNVMWVAVPGRDLTLFGNMERKSITNNDVESILRKITDLKVFQDVIHKGKKAASLSYNSPEYLKEVALATLGTEYAVNWARELHCVKIPAPSETLPRVASFLNESNNQYREGDGYVWSKFSNNCTHLSINTSHVMGISKSVKLDSKFIGKIINLALPSNTFLMYADQTVLGKMPSTKLLSKVLPRKGFYPVQVGAIMQNHPVYPSGDYFLTEDLSVLTLPRFLKPHKFFATPEKYEQKYMTPVNSDLRANATMWIDRYESLLHSLKQDTKYSEVELYLEKQLELARRIVEQEVKMLGTNE